MVDMADVNKPAVNAPAKVKPRPATPKHKPRKLPPFNVVLIDDDEHTYAYVIEMLQLVFGHEAEQAYKLAQEVDETGRVVVLTTHKEKAELKRDQIMGYGADPRIESCRGSMTAVIEPARSS